jgi:RimJ/RimL family protein N-acetyltransferase
MLRDRELMEMHVEALFAHDDHGRLLHVNDPNAADAPRFFLGQTAGGSVMRFRRGTATDLERELKAVAAAIQAAPALDSPIDAAPYRAILDRSSPSGEIWTGPAFTFPSSLPERVQAFRVTPENSHVLESHLAPWVPDVTTCQPMIAVAVDGQAVAVCASVRRTRKAHEAGIETVVAFRRRGYAAAAATEWARAVREEGRVPLYSTSWNNEASRALARKLGLLPFGNDLHIG